MVLRQHPFFYRDFTGQPAHLAAEAVQGPALPLQSVHHVKGGDGLAPGVLCVGDCIPDDILQKHLHERLPGVSPVVAMLRLHVMSRWCAGVKHTARPAEYEVSTGALGIGKPTLRTPRVSS